MQKIDCREIALSNSKNIYWLNATTIESIDQCTSASILASLDNQKIKRYILDKKDLKVIINILGLELLLQDKACKKVDFITRKERHELK